MKRKKRIFKTKKSAFLFALSCLTLIVATSALIFQNHMKADNGIYNTYYVRVDGGTDLECNGLSNLAYPGTGTNQNCAWKHPFFALAPQGYTSRLTGGDTLIIGAGDYKMGQSPEIGFPTDRRYGYCADSMTGSCTMAPVPSGPDADHPTRILGEGWDTQTGTKPQLWATEAASYIISLVNTNNVEVNWLELTDHSDCTYGISHSGQTCARYEYPHGEWGGTGIVSADSSNAKLTNLNIHGFAGSGITAGRISDWSLDHVRIAANASAGWQGDLDGTSNTSSNSGTISWKYVTVEWSGCNETYPELKPTLCRGQQAGGYGDGVGTGHTGGDWIIEDSSFLYNTQDGLDLLYHDQNSGTITLRRVRAEGSAGNQIKVNGNVTVENSVIVSNCTFFTKHPEYRNDGLYEADYCRAGGTAIVGVFNGGLGETLSITNSTIYSEGDVIIGSGPRLGTCDGSEKVKLKNNIILGDIEAFDPNDRPAYFYQEGCGTIIPEADYNIIYNGKMAQYPVGPHDIQSDPMITGPLSGLNYNMKLKPGSPALNAGTLTGAPLVDFESKPRDGNPDIGAYEGATSEGDISINIPSQLHVYIGKALTIKATVLNANSQLWEVVEGPGTLSFSDITSTETTISADRAGTYTVRLKANKDTYEAIRQTSVIVHAFPDIDGKNGVNFDDFTLLLANWGTPQNPMADLNDDGVVDFQFDFTTLLFNWNKS